MQKLSIILLLGLLIACKANSKKADVKTPREDFKNTLVALHLYEGGFSPTSFSEDSISENQIKTYDSIFTANHVNQEQFLEDYQNYVRNYPEELDSIYVDVVEVIKAKRDSISNSNGSTVPLDEFKKLDTIGQAKRNTVIKD